MRLERQTKRLVIVRGNYYEGNLGDDALCLALQELLRPYFVPGEFKFESQSLAHNITDGCLASIRDLSRAKALIYGGGTQFFSFSATNDNRTSIVRRLIRVLARPTKLRESYEARLRYRTEGKLPKVGLGLGFGPFVAGSSAEAAAAKLASQMAFLWIRDAASAQFCSQNRVQNFVESADLCFLPAFQEKYVCQAANVNNLQNRRHVGVVLRDWDYNPVAGGSIAPYLELASMCRRAGITVEFFVFSPKDTSVLRQLLESNEKVTCWKAQSMRLSAFAAELNRCDVVLASRYHACIFSLLLEKPFIAIGIEPKLSGIAQLFEMKGALVAANESASNLFDSIKNLLCKYDEYRERSRQVRDEQTRLAKGAENQFASFVKNTLT